MSYLPATRKEERFFFYKKEQNGINLIKMIRSKTETVI